VAPESEKMYRNVVDSQFRTNAMTHRYILPFLLVTAFFAAAALDSQTLPLPPRSASAMSGSALANYLIPLSRTDRENILYYQIAAGNVPDFLRTLCPVTSTAVIGGITRRITYYVTADYMAVGSNDDYFLTPMTPLLAQQLADLLHCTMPTRKMVNDIWTAAAVKLAPSPIPPTAEMITVPVFIQHNTTVGLQRKAVVDLFPLGALVGGDKKDVIISNLIYNSLKANVPKPVVIYGWHYLYGTPIQPSYNGHDETYADYSHGIRLVQLSGIIDTATSAILTDVMKDPVLYPLLSDEGVIAVPRYNAPPVQPPTVFTPAVPKAFAIIAESSTSARLIVTPLDDTTKYTVFRGKDGITFPDSVVLTPPAMVVSGLTPDSITYVKIKATVSAGSSGFSEVLAVIPSASRPRSLIVNGFDRASVGNTYNFVRQHGAAFLSNRRSFSSSTNDAVVKGAVSLNDYDLADYILGDESTVDETFSTAEQETLKTFLKNGGRLIASGSEIGWDLDYKGSAGDKDFCNNFLKAKYVADNPGSAAGTIYAVTATAGMIFDGMGTFAFDNGTHGTINVKYPDVLDGINGGQNCLQYAGTTGQNSAVSYKGMFAGGTRPGAVVTMGVPVETIYPDSVRALLLQRVLTFFDATNAVAQRAESLPEGFPLCRNYPNPFNNSTRFDLTVTRNEPVNVTVYDLLGRALSVIVDGTLLPGQYSYNWDAGRFASGVYFYCVRAGQQTKTQTMILQK
jgi:Secretion system C-terminal sorting domain